MADKTNSELFFLERKIEADKEVTAESSMHIYMCLFHLFKFAPCYKTWLPSKQLFFCWW